MGRENKTKDPLISEKDQLHRMIDDLQSQADSCKQLIETLQAEIPESKQTEEALGKSEERYRSLVENIDFGITIIDADHNVVMANSTVGRWFAKSPAEFVGKKCYQVFEKKSHPCSPCPGVEAMATGRPCEIETEGVRDDGSRFVVKNRAFPFYGPNGGIVGFQEVLEDITARKQAEEELRKASTYIDAMGATLIVLDMERKVTELNAAAMDLFGYSQEDICRLTFEKLFPESEHGKHYAEMKKSLEGCKIKPFETSVLTKNGNEVPVLISGSALKDSKGKPIGFVGVLKDITERKKVEEALQKEKTFAESIVQTAQAILLVLDAKGRIVSFNPYMEKISGYKIEEMCGKDWFDTFLPKQDHHLMRELFLKAVSDTQTKGNINPIITKNGELRQIEWHDKTLKDADGKMIGLLAIGQDITERKRAEEVILTNERQLNELNQQLSLKNEELQSIVYISSHDLKTPLVNINGFSALLIEHCEKMKELLNKCDIDAETKKEITVLLNDDIPTDLDYISTSTQRMERLIEGLLQVSRIGTVKIEVQKINMKDLVAEIINNVKYKMEELGAEITFEDLPDCTGDKNQITQVFMNLIDNSLKYLSGDRKGWITITGKTKDKESIYRVKDNGIGINPAYQGKIFEIYHRLNPQTATEGDGLGLTIVQRVLDRHKGRIWVESEEGKGSKFFVALPNVS